MASHHRASCLTRPEQSSPLSCDGACTVEQLQWLRAKYADLVGEELIRAFAESEFPGRIAIASSFGAEAAVLLNLIARVDPGLPILFLETGMLFDETLEYAARLGEELGLRDIRFLRPEPELLEWQDPHRDLWVTQPDRCCDLRKARPFRAALREFDCWVSGLKRAHGGVRAEIERIELEDGRIKVNPLADYTADDVAGAFETWRLPKHPLGRRGYRSIGCVPCTRMSREGDAPRAGRWARAEKSECGIHVALHARSGAGAQQDKGTGMQSVLGRSWFITGVCGTVGAELLSQVLQYQPQFVTAIDNNESDLFFLQDRFRYDQRIQFYVCDLRDRSELTARMAGTDIVLHAAALKHVILCEKSPQAAIQTNIVGTQNVVEAALACAVQRVLLTSSDKAVNPTNVMGTSKLMCERLMTAANARTRNGKQVFVSTRFGNVLGSRGSVVPIFKRQIAAGGPVTLTDPTMTRFIMTLSEAVKLVMKSVFLARGGEIFVTKMPVVRIQDLAEVLIEELSPAYGYDAKDIKVEVIGRKAGEKLYEELMNDEEMRRAIEIDEYFIVTPAFRSAYRDIDYIYPGVPRGGRVTDPYNSSVTPAMGRDDLRLFLRANGYLAVEDGSDAHTDSGRRWVPGLANGHALSPPWARGLDGGQLLAPLDGA